MLVILGCHRDIIVLLFWGQGHRAAKSFLCFVIGYGMFFRIFEVWCSVFSCGRLYVYLSLKDFYVYLCDDSVVTVYIR